MSYVTADTTFPSSTQLYFWCFLPATVKSDSHVSPSSSSNPGGTRETEAPICTQAARECVWGRKRLRSSLASRLTIQGHVNRSPS